jgi:hypothetical protein
MEHATVAESIRPKFSQRRVTFLGHSRLDDRRLARPAKQRTVGAFLILSRILLLSSSFALLSCSTSHGPSPESNKLAKEIVPKIEQWYHSGEAQLDLGKMLEAMNADQVCLIRQYSSIAPSLRRNHLVITDLFSADVDYVSETWTAIALVSGTVVHSALFKDRSIGFSMKRWTPCSSVKDAFLRKTVSKHMKNESAQLVSRREGPL